MSNAIDSTGILLQAGDGGNPEQWTTVAEIVALKPPSLSRNEIDVTNHNEGQEAKILGLLRKGQCTGTLNWLPQDATHSDLGAGIFADILSNRKRNWRIVYPPNPPGLPKWQFAARVQLLDPQEAAADTALQLAFALTIDGAITIINS